MCINKYIYIYTAQGPGRRDTADDTWRLQCSFLGVCYGFLLRDYYVPNKGTALESLGINLHDTYYTTKIPRVLVPGSDKFRSPLEPGRQGLQGPQQLPTF